MKTKLECTTGWVEIERLIDEGKEAIKLTTEIEKVEVSTALHYDSSEKADIGYNKMLAKKPNELKKFVLKIYRISSFNENQKL